MYQQNECTGSRGTSQWYRIRIWRHGAKAASNGHNVYMYTLTCGEASGDPLQREQELLELSKFMGAKAIWIENFQNAHLTVNSTLINHIKGSINKAHADLVITHSLNATHIMITVLRLHQLLKEADCTKYDSV